MMWPQAGDTIKATTAKHLLSTLTTTLIPVTSERMELNPMAIPYETVTPTILLYTMTPTDPDFTVAASLSPHSS